MQTACGEFFGPGGLIPSTPAAGHTMVLHDVPPPIANKALENFVAALHKMDVVEASQLAAEATIARMRASFPTATNVEAAAVEVLTLIQIRRQDVKAGKQPDKIPNKRSRT